MRTPLIGLLLLTATIGLVARQPEAPPPHAVTARQVEKLGRGVVAMHLGGGKVFVSWRLLGTDPEDIAFNVYRASGDGVGTVIGDAKADHRNADGEVTSPSLAGFDLQDATIAIGDPDV